MNFKSKLSADQRLAADYLLNLLHFLGVAPNEIIDGVVHYDEDVNVYVNEFIKAVTEAKPEKA